MESLLATFVTENIALYMMVFARVGTAMMVMPGIGDSFISPRVRLLFSLAFTVVISSSIMPFMPAMDMGTTMFLWIMAREIFIGFFIGTVARIFMSAVDTGGMLISMQMGLGNAFVFNPQFATQGSIVGAFLSLSAAVLLFATNLHHLLIYALIDSYQTFPSGGDMPLIGGVAQTIAKSREPSLCYWAFLWLLHLLWCHCCFIYQWGCWGG